MSTSYSDLGGGTYAPDPDDDTRCPDHPLCDNITGRTRDPNPLDRIPVACPRHRPVAAKHAGRARRRESVLIR